MKSRTIVAALILLCLAASVHAQPPASTTPTATAETPEQASLDRDIRHLLDLSGTSKLATQMLGTMIQSLKQAAPDAPTDFWDEFGKEVDIHELIEMIVPIYKKHLTHDDVRAAIAFYESPAGQHLVSNQPAILQDSMAAGQQWGQALAQRAMAKVNAAKNKH